MSEFSFNVIYQTIGIIGAILCASSFQCKNTKKLFLLQTVMSIIFVSQYCMGKAWAAALGDTVSVLRGLFFYFNKNKKLNTIGTVILCYLGIGSFFLSTFVFKQAWWMSLIICIATLTATIAFSTNNGKVIRIAQFFVVSPLWMTNNIIVFSIGGILAESLNLISIIIYYFRLKIKRKKSLNH